MFVLESWSECLRQSSLLFCIRWKEWLENIKEREDKKELGTLLKRDTERKRKTKRQKTKRERKNEREKREKEREEVCEKLKSERDILVCRVEHQPVVEHQK